LFFKFFYFTCAVMSWFAKFQFFFVSTILIFDVLWLHRLCEVHCSDLYVSQTELSTEAIPCRPKSYYHQISTLFIIIWLESLWKMLRFAVCFMKLNWVLSKILRILWVKVMGLNSKPLKISRNPICKFIHDITSGEWQNTFWAIQIFIELIFYFDILW
jgi:hypothetical protein